MGKIDELIKELCPDGVEYVKLGVVCNIDDGYPFRAKEILTEGLYPIVKIANLVNGKVGQLSAFLDNYPENIRDSQILQGGELLVAMSGSTGKTAYNELPDCVVNQRIAILRNKSIIDNSYLKHLLVNKTFSDYCNSNGTGPQKNISKNVLLSYLIPLPPLAIQQQIVDILDTFTDSISNLQEELKLREKQMEYYRENLLSFEDEEVEYKALANLGYFYGGLTGKSKTDFTNGNARFISYMNIFTNPSVNLDMEDTVVIGQGEKQNAIQFKDILFTGSSETPDECGMSSVVTKIPDEDYYLNSFSFGFRLADKSIFNENFLKHYFRGNKCRRAIAKTANGVTRFNVSKAKFKTIQIPLPSLSRQQEIVDILDIFESMIANIKEELELRQKQYEYYRDKLLTFERKGA